MKKLVIATLISVMPITSVFAGDVGDNNGTAVSVDYSTPVTVTVNNGNGEGTRDLSAPTDAVSHIQYSGEYTVESAPVVSVPNLTTTMTETCMGSTSMGGSTIGLGLSFGTTWRDSACVRRLDARQLQALGYHLGAKELMCDSDAVRAALKRAGKPCFKDLPQEVQKEVNPAAAEQPKTRTVVGGASGSSKYGAKW